MADERTRHGTNVRIGDGTSGQVVIGDGNHTIAGSRGAELAALTQLLDILGRTEIRAELSPRQRSTVDHEVETISAAIDRNDSRSGSVARAVTTILRTTGNLVKIAGGSGLFELLANLAR